MSFCIKCGLKNVPAIKFCIRCGAPLVRKTEAPSTTSNNSVSRSVPTEPQQTNQERFSKPQRESGYPSDEPRQGEQESLQTPATESTSSPGAGRSEQPDHERFSRPGSFSNPASEPTSSSFPALPPETSPPFNTLSWIAKNKSIIVIGIIAVLLFAGYRFYQSRSEKIHSETMAVDSTSQSGTTTQKENIQKEEPVENPLPYESKRQPAVQPPAPSATIEPGSDEWFKDHVARLYQAENQITNTNLDLTAVLEFYEFPLDRYYDAKRVDAKRLVKIYTDSYSGTLEHHLVRDYETKMTISRKEDGNVKVIAGCNFEFSTKQSPDLIRSRSVYNVYVFNANGKIISVYQLL